jgi:methionyl-tRNA synthetase
MDLSGAGPFPQWIVLFMLVVALWTMPWKGVALWRAGGNKHLGWFVALFLLNTLAILEIIYIFGFSKKKQPLQ